MSMLPIDYPVKININFMIEGEVATHILELNQKIVRNGHSDIDFSNSVGHLPHITLIMGEVGTKHKFENLVKLCGEFFKRKTAIPYHISQPYLKEPSQQYVFVDILPQAQFREFRLDLFDYVGEFIEYDDHGSPTNTTHITVGYYKSNYRRIRLSCANMQLEGVANSIRICEVGTYGTCVRTYQEIKIG